MSEDLRKAILRGQKYLQSPLDDLWAFFHTMVWATLFNFTTSAENLGVVEQEWRTQIAHTEDYRTAALVAICERIELEAFNDLSSILQGMLPVIDGWRTALNKAKIQWKKMDNKLKATSSRQLEKSDFDLVAYKGILDFARVLNNCKAGMIPNSK